MILLNLYVPGLCYRSSLLWTGATKKLEALYPALNLKLGFHLGRKRLAVAFHIPPPKSCVSEMLSQAGVVERIRLPFSLASIQRVKALLQAHLVENRGALPSSLVGQSFCICRGKLRRPGVATAYHHHHQWPLIA